MRLMDGINFLYLRQKRSWPISLKIYQHPTTLTTKFLGISDLLPIVSRLKKSYYKKRKRFGRLFADLFGDGERST